MPPRSRSRGACQICNAQESKYSCSKCYVLYCSVPCYKKHKESSCTVSATPTEDATVAREAVKLESVLPADHTNTTDDSVAQSSSFSGTEEKERVSIKTELKPNTETEIELEEKAELRPLTSLNWPYVPEESAYPDPLKRDDPKPLQLNQYEAIATSSAVRNALASHPRLKDVLRKIDLLRGQEREEALQRALGVSQYDVRGAVPNDISFPTSNRTRFGHGGRSSLPENGIEVGYVEEDKVALRELAEAVETAVRGGKEGTMLGLDWGDTDSGS